MFSRQNQNPPLIKVALVLAAIPLAVTYTQWGGTATLYAVVAVAIALAPVGKPAPAAVVAARQAA